MADSLTDRQQRFVNEYCIDLNATQAAIRAGYAEGSAQETGSRLLSIDILQAAVEERKQEIATAAKIDAVWVLRQWHDIATADPNELMQLRHSCCRHCYGLDFAYQWIEAEYNQEVEKAIAEQKETPSSVGGFGFNPKAEPNPDCIVCFGDGITDTYFEDTRKLKGRAKRLYAGVQKTKDGLKILTRDQDAALLNISRYLGMLVDKKEVSGPNGGPIGLAGKWTVEFVNATPDE